MTTRTIDTLLEIMDTSDLFTSRRIEAAETILGFEAPADAVMRARDYLMSVFENREETINDRMDALKASRKAEAAKVSPKVVHLTRREEVDRKEAWRMYEIWTRRKSIIKATSQIPPKDYAEDLWRDDYLPPPGDEWPPINIVRDPVSGFRFVSGDKRD
jgi:hypothetical protein